MVQRRHASKPPDGGDGSGSGGGTAQEIDAASQFVQTTP